MVGVICAAYAQGVIDACAGSDKVMGCAVLLYDVPVVKFRVGLKSAVIEQAFAPPCGVRCSDLTTTKERTGQSGATRKIRPRIPDVSSPLTCRLL